MNIFWSESYPPGAEDGIHRSDRLPLPDGRFWNNTGWDKMYPEDRDPEEGIQGRIACGDWWPRYVRGEEAAGAGQLVGHHSPSSARRCVVRGPVLALDIQLLACPIEDVIASFEALRRACPGASI